MSGVYRIAFRIIGVPNLPQGTNYISREFRWLGVASDVQFAAEYGEDPAGTPIPTSIRFAFELAAESAEEAAWRAEEVAETIGRIIAFQAGAAYARPLPVALVDATPGLTRRLYRQWCYDVLPARPSRPILTSDLETTAHSLGHRTDLERDPILRGLKWYTDALYERSVVDRFVKAWVGLESIGAILNRRTHRSGWRNCRKCLGSTEDREKDERQERGIRHLFSVHQPSLPDLFGDLKRARNKLVHGEWSIGRVVRVIHPHVETTLDVLARGLLTALAPHGAVAGTRQALQPLRVVTNTADSVVSVTLTAPRPNDIGELRDFFDVEFDLRSSNEGPDGYYVQGGYTINGALPCRFDDFRVQSARTSEDGIVVTTAEQPEVLEIHEVGPGGKRRLISSNLEGRNDDTVTPTP